MNDKEYTITVWNSLGQWVASCTVYADNPYQALDKGSHWLSIYGGINIFESRFSVRFVERRMQNE